MTECLGPTAPLIHYELQGQSGETIEFNVLDPIMIMRYLLEINTHPPWYTLVNQPSRHSFCSSALYQCGFGVTGLMSGSSDLGIEFVQVVLGRKPQRSVAMPTTFPIYRWINIYIYIYCIQVTPYTIVLSQTLPIQLSGICKGTSSIYQQSLPHATLQKADGSVLGSK